LKYRYLYQTSENENREGEIRAYNRARAYALLRQQGIRPYRLIGDDPPGWLPWGAAALAALLIAGLVTALVVERKGDDDHSPRLRQQIVGDPAFIAKGVANDWSEQLSTPLDRYLAAYAQPGGSAVPPYVEPEAVEAMRKGLDIPLDYPQGERSESRQLRNIVAYLRDEMRAAIDAGMSVAEHFEFLEKRQREEISLRQHAEQSIAKAPDSYREKMAAGINAQLRSRGIAPVKISAPAP